MKFCLVGPGGTSIPPTGWGAVESIIWDYHENLTQLGHTVFIINTTNRNSIIQQCNSYQPDVIYIMYDDHIVIAPYLKCNKIYYMSHYAYITNPKFPELYSYYYKNIFCKVLEYQDHIILNAISKDVLDVYIQHGYQGKYNIISNGARQDLFSYVSSGAPLLDHSIYIAKIEYRKGQYKYQKIPNIHFVGNYHDSPFDTSNPNYIGHWDKSTLYQNLTHYSNLVLLSNGEADPLVVKEALIAGLGIVVSEYAAANLDPMLPFITIIPNSKLDDIDFVQQKIHENRIISRSLRPQIRHYGLSRFSWNIIINQFLTTINTSYKKIALVGPGIMPIPPPGWGAVEILIWDYYNELIHLGYQVEIINPIRKSSSDQSNPFTPYCQNLISTINSGNYDFVHIHYDCLYHIIPFLLCSRIGITSHYPYIDQTKKHIQDGFHTILDSICQNNRHTLFALCQKDYDTFFHRASHKKNIQLLKNGANHREILFIEPDKRTYKDKSIYIGKIENRKQQFKYCSIPNIDFYGKCQEPEFIKKSCYKGEYEHSQLMKIMPQYANLVLLSLGESDPLVIKEALMAGLPIVSNRHSLPDLTGIDPSFIDIIPDDKLNDLDYIESVIIHNLQKQKVGQQIREYAIQHFSWEQLVQKYIQKIL